MLTGCVVLAAASHLMYNSEPWRRECCYSEKYEGGGHAAPTPLLWSPRDADILITIRNVRLGRSKVSASLSNVEVKGWKKDNYRTK